MTLEEHFNAVLVADGRELGDIKRAYLHRGGVAQLLRDLVKGWGGTVTATEAVAAFSHIDDKHVAPELVYPNTVERWLYTGTGFAHFPAVTL